MKPIEDGAVDPDGYIRSHNEQELRDKYQSDWPTHCDCGYEFTEADPKQIFSRRKYVDDKGNFTTTEDAPVGAIWRAHWYEEVKGMSGTDGKCYVCKTPGGDWVIDGRASNCTKPDDSEHKCWCRHGEAPNFTVNKAGNTCAAGAGSILIGDYHGFLTNGELTNC
jgi:hypothetical protein